MHADEIHHAKTVETELFLGIYRRLTRADNSAVCTVDMVDAADASMRRSVMTSLRVRALRLYEVAFPRDRLRLLMLGRGFSKKLTPELSPKPQGKPSRKTGQMKYSNKIAVAPSSSSNATPSAAAIDDVAVRIDSDVVASEKTNKGTGRRLCGENLGKGKKSSIRVGSVKNCQRATCLVRHTVYDSGALGAKWYS